MLDLRRKVRYGICEIRQRLPARLIPRHRRAEACERILAEGTVRVALDEHHARAGQARVKAWGPSRSLRACCTATPTPRWMTPAR